MAHIASEEYLQRENIDEYLNELGIIFVRIFTFVFNFLSKSVKTSEMQTVPIFSEEK